MAGPLARYGRVGKQGLLLFGMTACGASGASPAAPAPPAPPSPASYARADEPHLADVRRLTFGGENAEAYWAWNGDQLIFQARGGTTGQACDRIYRMSLAAGGDRTPVSSGRGATTCSFFLPGDREVIYASTHLAGDACPPRPDMTKGYVWALYDSYDIFRANADGSNLRRLTDTKGYDAEGTVCGKDGSIVFTSTRDGDIDLYRMDADGSNVRRLTNTPGYDGGAFFNADCTKIVWRASRPKPGKELDEYRALLAQGLVKPTKLELYVADADGSDPVQLTYLDAASFAPYWHPSQRRVVFASNYGDPKGREFDLWAIDTSGTRLERLTFAPGFDGFPMFSPDGRTLAFSSNRATPPGAHDTDVYLARWVDSAPLFAEAAPDRVMRDVAWLADPAREGRGIGTAGLAASGAYVEERFKALGLAPSGDAGGFREAFPVVTGVRVGPATALVVGGKPAEAVPLGYSATGKVAGRLVFAGHGVVAKEKGIDEYTGVDARGKVVLVRRFVPPNLSAPEEQRRYGDLRYKAWVAREHGAKALLVADFAASAEGEPTEAPLPEPQPEGRGDTGIPVMLMRRDPARALATSLSRGARVDASLEVDLVATHEDAFNVVGRLFARAPEANRLPGVVVVGAHYDHLGMGGANSLAPDRHEPHLGADDNASGTSAVLEVARALASAPERLRRDVVFVAFSGEEAGVLGSTQMTRSPPAGLAMKDVVAMLNMDMVGRMRANSLSVIGADSADEWREMALPACEAARVDCTIGGDGYGPSDHMPFYAAGVPVLFFFTGAHNDYHKPSDSADRINAAGAAQVARIVEDIALAVDARPGRLTYRQMPAPAPHGDMRGYRASLGTIPDYAGPPGGRKGVLLAGVRPGGAADKAGLAHGDVLIRLGPHAIGSVEDLMYALNAHKPGETLTAIVVRNGAELKVDVTLQEGHRR
jgi:Peptidase family M28/PDZ domain/WD40-like Beta Propeller Repeat/PA domain